MAQPKAPKRRTTIGKNPLDALLTEEEPRSPEREAAPAKQKPQQGGSVRQTFHLAPDLIETVKDAVVALSGPPVRLTLASLAASALRLEVERLQKEHNRGRPFPKRDGDPRVGRPIGS
jgi:hypothetical protein